MNEGYSPKTMYNATPATPSRISRTISRGTSGLEHPDAFRGRARCNVQPRRCLSRRAGCGGGSFLTLRRKLTRFCEVGVCVRVGKE